MENRLEATLLELADTKSRLTSLRYQLAAEKASNMRRPRSLMSALLADTRSLTSALESDEGPEVSELHHELVAEQ